MAYERFDLVVVPFPFTDSAASKRRPALVIMAITLCPAGRLKISAFDSTSAGRLLLVAESVKGKGTTTSSKRS